ncbi:cellulose synthase BcsB subunit [Labrys okinawensis]|uniref:Cyclic di-GMP-binding protein n=1 Tax=Labrys okinawensis TaxID=346911 RepID=A0A2S9QI39_9HYPH|nr:cellulose biosynthesis cyclic di-GMP-binding regulatory protein BcsB [Labrys okinawensis]PRH89026.1 cellulose synthase BcsB subunit [Labrys okinawensis]
MRGLIFILVAMALPLAGLSHARADQSASPFDMAPERSNAPAPALSPSLPSPVPPTPTANPAPQPAAPPPAVDPTPPPSPQVIAPPSALPKVEAAQAETFDRPLMPFRHLVLEGEVDSRAWYVVLTKNQVASPTTLTLGYKASVVVAPEASRLILSINNQTVFDSPITASDQTGKLSAELPANLLKAGPNLVRLQVVQRHRTDCTINSTYELRTEIDSVATAFHFASSAAARLSRVEDLAATAPDANGLTHLRIIAPSLGAKASANPILRFAQAASILIGMPNLDVLVTDRTGDSIEPGTVTAVIGTVEEVRPLLRTVPRDADSRPIVTFVDDPALGPSTLLVSGPDAASVSKAVDAVGALVDRPRGNIRDMLDTSRWFAPNPPLLLRESHVRFASLGVPTQEFAGRRFRTEFQIGLPSDFYSVSAGEATLLLDAAYSGEVLPGSHLDIYVNGNIAATTPLRTSGGEILRHLPIRIPMTHFRPGPNRVTFEAQLFTTMDSQCAAGPTKGNNRFALFDSSEFVMPDYARIAQQPNLAALQGTAFPYNGAVDPVALVVSRYDSPVMSATATLLARMALAAGRLINIDPNAPSLDDRHALFVAPAPDIPEQVPAQLNLDEQLRTGWKPHNDEPILPSAAAGNPPGPTLATLPVAATEPADTQETFDRWRDTLKAEGGGWRGNVSSFQDWLQRTFQVSSQTLRFLPSRDVAFHPSRDTSAMIAQGPSPSGNKTWTLLTAPSTRELRAGANTLTSSPQWFQLSGRLATYNTRLAEVQIQPVTTSSLTATQPLSFTNLRLIAANWLSENLLAFAFLLFAACLLLGLATALLLSRIGRRISQ